MIEWWQSLIWGSPSWRVPALVIACMAGAAVLAAYATIRGPRHVRWLAASLKAVAIATLVFCLLDPMRSEERPQPGANLFVVLADNSRSGALQDANLRSVQGQIETALRDEQWQARLGQDFDVRRYQFDDRLQSVGDWSGMSFDGARTSLASALGGLRDRFRGQPLAGVLLLTDGNATDNVERWLQRSLADGEPTPPIFPVQFRNGDAAADALIRRVTVRETNFETSPVIVTADVAASGFPEGTPFDVRLLTAGGEVMDETTVSISDGEAAAVELRARPEAAGQHVYRLILSPKPETEIKESTEANNQRLVIVRRERGPYRLLYVAGRPNWEFKFLRRAAEEDAEMDLVALLRIARKEPKFVFRDRDTGSANPLFQGFEDKDPDDVEQYDQPVVIRIGDDEEQVAGGFPKDAESLFGFQGIILDDLESNFFDADQLALIKEFVSQRGGGLLMLGGAGSFASGGYDETPLGDMLPIYLNDVRTLPADPSTRFQIKLSREGWLQPWVRVRASEAEERQRLKAMPAFETINVAKRIKPGATVLASVDVLRLANSTNPDLPSALPALISQRYGKGRTAALMVGDYWKWATSREFGGERDLEKAWRQMLRWLISEVPERVEAAPVIDGDSNEVVIQVDVRDEAYRPLDNAELSVTVATPSGREVTLATAPAKQAGAYQAKFANREAGAYIVRVEAKAPDGSEIGATETGWTHEPDADEFQSLAVNQTLLNKLAEETGGALMSASSLNRTVANIAQRKAVINEKRLTPVWHRWYVFLFAALCLAGEWGLRRWHGLP